MKYLLLFFKKYVERIEAVIADKDPVIEDMPVIENEENVWQLIYPQAVYVRRRFFIRKNGLEIAQALIFQRPLIRVELADE